MTELKYWLWLTLLDGISSRKITTLLDRFTSPEEIYRANPKDFTGIEEITEKDVSRLSEKSLAAAESVMEECKRKGIRILTFDNPAYPENLANIYDPPYVLYVRGHKRIPFEGQLFVAVVGNRELTDYGRAVTLDLCKSLARAGITIVSGMARGIDGAAHAGALSGGGKTIAVLGCGVDRVYPPEHRRLMEEIMENGMLLSEYPPGTPPIASHFPQRNRIISGLSSGVVVTEAPQKSGSLITASLALEQGRDVFAIPGDIGRPRSEGTNTLIRDGGAKLITSAFDIILEYREQYIGIYEAYLEKQKEDDEKGEETAEKITDEFKTNTVKSAKLSAGLPQEKAQSLTSPVINEMYETLSESERLIADLLTLTPMHADTLLAKTGLNAEELNVALTMLEIKGVIEPLPGRHFILKV